VIRIDVVRVAMGMKGPPLTTTGKSLNRSEPHHPNCRYGWSIHWLTYGFPKRYAPNRRMARWKLISEANVCRVLNASEGTFAFADNHSLSGMDLRYSLKKYLAPMLYVAFRSA